MSWMDDGKNYVREIIDEKLGSTLFKSFLIAWSVVNCQLIYATFFVDQEHIWLAREELKIEYIKDLFFSIPFYNGEINSTFPLILLLLLKDIIAPLTLAYFFVKKPIPKIDRAFAIWAKQNEKIKEIELLELDKKYIKQESVLVEKKEEAVHELIEKKTKLKSKEKDLNQEDKWDLEYESMTKTTHFLEALEDLRLCLYQHNGQLSVRNEYREQIYSMNSSLLSVLHLNDLVEFNNTAKDSISPTAKGKYFLKKYIDSM